MTPHSKIALALLGIMATAVAAVLILRAVAIGNEARREIGRLFSHVPLGASRDEVDRIFSTNAFHRLRLVEVSEDLLLARTPLEWGAGNWVLRVELHDGKVAAVKVRIQDDSAIRPDDAPPDKEENERKGSEGREAHLNK